MTALIDRITVVREDRQDIDPALLERLRSTAAAQHLAADPEADLWAGDGYLIPTRTDGENLVFTYVPED